MTPLLRKMMLLSELHGYKQYLGKTLQSALAKLSDKDLRFKNGSYAFVVKSENKSYVYKVWTHDPAFDSWLKYAVANPSKYMIKVLSPVKELKLLVDVNRTKEYKLKCVKLEKLDTLPRSLYHLVEQVFHAALDLIGDEQELTIKSLKSYLDEDEHEDLELNQPFFEAYLDVAKSMLAAGHAFDGHSDNIMWRESNLCMVITDPASKKNGYSGVTAPDLMLALDTELKRA
jgi:hypothetical protein